MHQAGVTNQGIQLKFWFLTTEGCWQYKAAEADSYILKNQ